MLFRFLALLLALPILALADELPGYPGWSISELQPEDIGASEEGVSYASQTFFTLKPPDARPAITLNVRTAQRLRAGEIGPEAAYTGSHGSEKSEKKEEEEKKSSAAPASSYAWNGNGFSAIPSNSTGSSSSGHNPSVAGFNGLPSTPIGAGPAVNPNANLGLGGSGIAATAAGANTPVAASGPVDPNGIGPVKALNSKVGEVTMTGGTPVVTACAAMTFENCKLNAGTSGQAAAGSCAAGMTGSCSYTCSNAVWVKASNSCSSPAAGRGMEGDCKDSGFLGSKRCYSGPPQHR